MSVFRRCWRPRGARRRRSRRQPFKPNTGDLVDLGEGSLELGPAVVLYPFFERRQNFCAVHAGHGKDERELEFLLVKLVQDSESRELLGRALIKASASLLGAGCLGQDANAEPAAEIGMIADELQLRISIESGGGGGERRRQSRWRIAGRTESAVPGAPGNLGKVLVYAAEFLDEFRPGHAERRWSESWRLLFRHFSAPSACGTMLANGLCSRRVRAALC